MSVESSDDELEVMDYFSPPSRRKPKPKSTPRKRPAPGSNRTGFNGSPPAKRTPKPARVKQEKSEAMKNAPKIVIGLDFGTTYTGFGFNCSKNSDQTRLLMDLDDSNRDDPKVPSAIQFIGDRLVWGNNVEKGADNTIQWFKLLLIDQDDLPEEVRNSERLMEARERLRELDLTCEDVVAAYLGEVWKHGLEKMKTEIGRATVERSQFHIVVTLPAIWPDYSHGRMLQAVQAAGILEKRQGVADTALAFISEPEAAVLATLKSVEGRCDVKPGDCFVVCDCGGGTVDLITYKVVSVNPMVVCEVVKGTGALAGATFIDANFITRLLKKKFDTINPQLWAHITAAEIELMMKENWYDMRNTFKGDSCQGGTIRIPTRLFRDGLLDHRELESDMLNITSEDVKDVFRPVLTKIATLVLQQVHSVSAKQGQDPKYIVLVGGFGRCKYLYEWLKTRTGGIEVLQSRGNEPWTAICRGAVIHGMTTEKIDSSLGVEVQSRVARASFGITCKEDWDKDIHSTDDKVFDPKEQRFKAQGQMKWLIKEGEDLKPNQKVRHDFYKLVELGNIPKSLSTTIWMSNTLPPPSRKDGSVVKYSEMNWTAKINWAKLPPYSNSDGKMFYELKYEATMQRSAGSPDLAIMHNGKKQATRNVKVEFFDKADI